MQLGESVQYGNTTITKTKEAQPLGEYKSTAVDQQKADASFLLIQVSPNIINSKIKLKGRGITPYSDVTGCYRVTDKALEKLENEHCWATDF